MVKTSPKIVAVLSFLTMIYALFDDFNKEILIGSLLIFILSIGMISNS